MTDVTVMSELCTDKICFGPKRKLKTGQEVTPVSLTEGCFDMENMLHMQFGDHQDAMLLTEWGLNTPRDGADVTKRNVDIEVGGELEAKMRALDGRIVDYVTKHTQELFKSSTLTRQYCPLVQEKRDKPGSCFVRVKVVMPDGESKPTEVQLLKDDGVYPSKAEAIGRNAKVLVIAHTLGVWYSAMQFGLSLRAESIIVKPAYTRPTGMNRFRLKPGLVEHTTPAADEEGGDVVETHANAD